MLQRALTVSGGGGITGSEYYSDTWTRSTNFFHSTINKAKAFVICVGSDYICYDGNVEKKVYVRGGSSTDNWANVTITDTSIALDNYWTASGNVSYSLFVFY